MYFRQPAYYSDFKCIGGDCKFTCCSGWRIDWTEEEIEKIKKSPECSEELRALTEKVFEKYNRGQEIVYKIILNDKQQCPFHTEEGLCRIQKELGEDYLSYTCSIFPRRHRFALDINTESYTNLYRFCNLSCPEIAKRVVSDPKAMNLTNVPVKENVSIEHPNMENDDICEEHPEFLFRTNMFEFFYSLISDKRYSLETAIINGAIAAGILTDIVKEKQYAAIPQALEEMREGFLKGNMFRELDNIKPDYNIKVGFVGKVIKDKIAKSTMNLLITPDGKLDLAKYMKGEKKLSQMFDGDDFWLRNIALNLLFELSVPLYSTQYTILESYSLFIMAIACIKFNAISSVSTDTPWVRLVFSDGYSARFMGADRVWGFASVISRSLSQNLENAEKVISSLRDANLTTPGQLALLIK